MSCRSDNGFTGTHHPNQTIKAIALDTLLFSQAIAESSDEDTTIIILLVNRLPTGIRYWLEDLLNIGVNICAIANNNPSKDIFLEMLELELDLLLIINAIKRQLL